MRTIENDIPEIFLELAREAVALGFSEVTLGFMYLDADFVSPIEWGLWLTKRESNSEAREYVLLTMGRNSEEKSPTAYIPNPNGNPLDGNYWGPEEVRSWMQEPLAAEGEYVLAWNPVGDPEDQDALLAHWPLFELGVRSGWTMQYSAQWDRLHEIKQMLVNHDQMSRRELFVPLKIEWSITNSFYNTKGHPDHRSTGAPVSVRGWGSISFGREEFYEPVKTKEGPRLSPLAKDSVEKTLGANHPWFVRVAYDDEAGGKWLHFPEALKSPSKTLDPSKFQRGETP